MLPTFACGLFLLLIDQWSKRSVHAHAQERAVRWGPFVRIQYVTSFKNIYERGFARLALALTWCCAVGAAILLHRCGAWFQTECGVLGLGLAIGGAAGNLLDILRRHSVVDFIDLGWWPVFNIADVAILVGLLMAFWPQA